MSGGNFGAITLSTSVWFAFYKMVCFANSKRQPEFCSRVVTLFHGLIMTTFGISQCFAEEGSPVFNPQHSTTLFQYLILVTSLGYFIVDLMWCIYYQTETRLMLSHHIISCVGLFLMSFSTKSGGQVCCSLGALEVTNPLLQTRWFVRTYGYQNTLWFAMVEVLFILTFVLVRIGFGTIFFLAVISNKDNTWGFVILAAAMYIISWMFLINIYQFVKVKYTLPYRQQSLDERIDYVPQPAPH